ncbi:Protein of unknown function [Bacillus mycoides]|nr:Protein of unknown function [Bacillus mycoides]
MPALKEIEQ